MQVTLSYDIPGVLVKRGVYHDVDGRTLVRPQYSSCKVRTILSEAFCSYAITTTARPEIHADYHASNNWNRMSAKDRLIWHILALVYAKDGENPEFEII